MDEIRCRLTRVVVLFACSAVAVDASAQATTSIAWETFAISAQNGRSVEAERGWLDVPERHARPDGPHIRLRVMRLRSTSANAGPPIVWLAGGPGNSGTGNLQSGLLPLFEALRANGDVIAFDQRGTGASQPSLVMPDRLELPSDKSILSAEASARMVAVAHMIREAMTARGIDLDAYNTQESADDVDALRQALGIEQIALWSYSYGTHLGLAVIKRHGRHVARAILGGVSGLDQRWREPADGDELLATIERKLQAAAGGSPVPFRERVRRVFAQLDADPIRVDVGGKTVRLGKAEIQLLIAVRSGEIDFIRNLPGLITRLEQRSDLGAIGAAFQQGLQNRPIGTVMTYSMHIASGVSAARAQRIAAQAPTALLGDAINMLIGDAAFAKALGVPDLGDAFRAPFQSDVPVLLISADLDGRTSIPDARAVARQFQRRTHILIEGASHDFWRASPRLVEIMQAFLRGERPRDETLAVPVQFR
jgi:pimeloyl-ACP methyl ester carboxylesterase